MGTIRFKSIKTIGQGQYHIKLVKEYLSFLAKFKCFPNTNFSNLYKIQDILWHTEKRKLVNETCALLNIYLINVDYFMISFLNHGFEKLYGV